MGTYNLDGGICRHCVKGYNESRNCMVPDESKYLGKTLNLTISEGFYLDLKPPRAERDLKDTSPEIHPCESREHCLRRSCTINFTEFVNDSWDLSDIRCGEQCDRGRTGTNGWRYDSSIFH